MRTGEGARGRETRVFNSPREELAFSWPCGENTKTSQKKDTEWVGRVRKWGCWRGRALHSWLPPFHSFCQVKCINLDTQQLYLQRGGAVKVTGTKRGAIWMWGGPPAPKEGLVCGEPRQSACLQQSWVLGTSQFYAA